MINDISVIQPGLSVKQSQPLRKDMAIKKEPNQVSQGQITTQGDIANMNIQGLIQG